MADGGGRRRSLAGEADLQREKDEGKLCSFFEGS
ncbi:hypothetical protein ES332_A03G041900v1 [Gossypium tomentosum]|uniref:Uncharacterized protein n=1 Tax=Gossypium tomentosum TaxID=34277 RepID=A0A5D2R235_GOSTO|nr:hypothetical protein ES332_A03G041900v1 [Gossypium tomentosum]